MDASVFPGGEDDESGDAAAEGGAGAAGGVDCAAAEAGHDGHGAHEGAHEVARAQGEHLEQHLGGEDDDEEEVDVVQGEGPRLRLTVVVAHHGHLE